MKRILLEIYKDKSSDCFSETKNVFSELMANLESNLNLP